MTTDSPDGAATAAAAAHADAARTAPDDAGSGLATFRRNVWWGLAGTVGCVLGLAVGDWVIDPAVPVAARVVTGMSTATAIVACGVLISRRLSDRAPHPAWIATAVTAGVVAGAVPLAAGDAGLWSVVPAAVLAVLVMFLPSRRAWQVIAAAAVAAPVTGLVAARLQGEPDTVHAAWMPFLMVAVWGPPVLGFLSAWRVAARLDEARRLAAHLAVADERLRFAAELHDVQGHHLQVIALKSELAARLAPSDPDAAAVQMREVQDLAAAALRETRAVVHGYRRTTLEAELANASRVLEAAGVSVGVETDPEAARRLAPEARSLLGLVVREATTNVLRHAAARSTRIDLRGGDDAVRLSVTNDGAEEPGAAAIPAAIPGGGAVTPRAGSGLDSLTERLAAIGGELAWHRDHGTFTLTATVGAA